VVWRQLELALGRWEVTSEVPRDVGDLEVIQIGTERIITGKGVFRY